MSEQEFVDGLPTDQFSSVLKGISTVGNGNAAANGEFGGN